MPRLDKIIKDRKKKGKPVGDFLSPGEVDVLLRGVTGEADEPDNDHEISEDDWAAAMAEQCICDEHDFPNRIKIDFTADQVSRLLSLLDEQKIIDLYDIYHLLKVNGPR